MYKGKGQESRDLYGKVRTIQPLWMACGVKQLLMRVFRTPTHPFQADKDSSCHHASQQPGIAVAGSQAWMGLLSTAFPRNEYTKALHEAFPFPNRKQECWICFQIPLLTVPLSWCTESQQCTEGESEVQES